jgi:hypothetical protein
MYMDLCMYLYVHVYVSFTMYVPEFIGLCA